MSRIYSHGKHTVRNVTFRNKGGSESFSEITNKALVSNATFILYLYFVIDFFLRFSVRVPGYGVLRPTLLMVLIISAVLFAQRESLKGRFNDPVFKAIFILLGYLLISLPLVEWPGSVVRTNIDTFVKAIVFLFFTALIIDTEKRLKWFIAVFVFCQVFRVIEPLYLNISGGYWGSSTHLQGGDFANRLAGAPADVINPNELGFVIVTAIPFLHYLLWPKGWKSKVLYCSLMPLLLYALILTMSRGAFVVLLVVAFFIFKESRHKLFLLVLGATLIVAALSVMSPVQKDRYLSLVSEDTAGSATVDGRLRGMVSEFKLGLSRPVVGHGLGTTSEAKVHKTGRKQASHNLYAELLIEIGIFGFVFFLRYLYLCYRKLRSNHSKFLSSSLGSDHFYARLNKTLIVVFWVYAVYSINYWGLSQYYWYLFGGLVIAFGRLVDLENKNPKEDTSGSLVRQKYPLAQRLSR